MQYKFTHKTQLRGDQFKLMYERMKNDVTLWKALWYDGPPESYEDWIWRNETWWLALVENGKEPVGFFWLNGYMGRTAQIHFAIFEECRQDSVQIGKAALAWLDELGWLHSVYGLTPATHRHVFPFIKALGFQILGNVPGACWVERKNKYVDGVASVYDFRRQR